MTTVDYVDHDWRDLRLSLALTVVLRGPSTAREASFVVRYLRCFKLFDELSYWFTFLRVRFIQIFQGRLESILKVEASLSYNLLLDLLLLESILLEFGVSWRVLLHVGWRAWVV